MFLQNHGYGIEPHHHQVKHTTLEENGQLKVHF